jgi:hypothetical protein
VPPAPGTAAISSEETRRAPTSNFVIAAGVVAAAFAAAMPTAADPDLWGHVRFGLDLIRDRVLTSADPYSFTQDRPWIDHEWLAELQMGLVYAMGHGTGLVVLKGVLVLASVAVIWRGLRHTEFGARLLWLAFAVVGAGGAFKTLRPQLWSLLFFAVMCRVLSSDRTRLRWWLPLGFAVWANCHGAWFVGLGVLAAWMFGEVRTWSSAASGTALVLACGVATLFTPYGWRLWTFVLDTVHVGRDITEWQPLWTKEPVAIALWFITVGVGVAALRRADARRASIGLVLVLLAYFSARVARVLPFFVIAAATLGASAIAAAPRAAQRLPELLVPMRLQIPAAILCLLFAAWTGDRSGSCIDVAGPWIPDDVAAGALRSPADGRLVTLFNWGEYAIWKWGPVLKVSIDGRRETVFSDRVLAEDDAIERDEPDASPLTAWHPEYVWLPTTHRRTAAWLLARGYRIDIRTERSYIAVRNDVTPVLHTTSIATPGARCFPN